MIKSPIAVKYPVPRRHNAVSNCAVETIGGLPAKDLIRGNGRQVCQFYSHLIKVRLKLGLRDIGAEQRRD